MKIAIDDLDELNEIASRIKELKKELNPIENKYNARIKSMDKILDNIRNVEEALRLDTFEQMFRAIQNNLPDEIILEDDETNKKSKKIVSGENVLGRIEVIGDEDINFKVQIEINDFVAMNQIANTGKIYTIINFINDKLNYKNDEFTVEKNYNNKSIT